MKTIEIWSRDIDRKILAGFCMALGLALTVLIGALVPRPVPGEYIWMVNASIAVALLVFLWGAFRLIRPIHYRRAWIIAELIAIPLLWLLIITALGFWFGHLRGTWELETMST